MTVQERFKPFKNGHERLGTNIKKRTRFSYGNVKKTKDQLYIKKGFKVELMPPENLYYYILDGIN